MSGVEPTRRRPGLRGWMIFAIAGVVAIAAGGLTGRVIAARSGGTAPSDSVVRFFQALRDNDAKTVLSELATPPSDTSFITHESLAKALRHAHSEYSLALNRSERRSGHVWQNRYYSCPMSADRLLSALRYVELNPVRAGMAGAAWDWPWSSARAHTATGTSDGVLCCDWIEYFGRWDHDEWREILAAGSPSGECEALRRATQTGEPLGPPDFITALEREAGRRLRVWKRGRRKKEPASPDERARQGCLFADSLG